MDAIIIGDTYIVRTDALGVLEILRAWCQPGESVDLSPWITAMVTTVRLLDQNAEGDEVGRALLDLKARSRGELGFRRAFVDYMPALIIMEGCKTVSIRKERPGGSYQCILYDLEKQKVRELLKAVAARDGEASLVHESSEVERYTQAIHRMKQRVIPLGDLLLELRGM